MGRKNLKIIIEDGEEKLNTRVTLPRALLFP